MIKKNFGFTLIELIVVLVIVGLLLGISFPIFKVVGNRRSTSQGANLIKQMIDKAKILSMAPAQNFTPAPGGTSAYQIYFEIGGVGGTVIYLCEAVFGSASSCDDSNDIAKVTLPKRVNVSVIAFADSSLIPTAVNDIGASGIQFAVGQNGIRIIEDSIIYPPSGIFPPNEAYFVIKVNNLNDTSTKDIFMQTLTGITFIK